MKGIEIICGPLSEEGKRRLAEHSRKHKERLEKFTQDCKNTIIEKGVDGFIKITIPSLGIITWASDIEDSKVAISEAIESHRIISNHIVSKK